MVDGEYTQVEVLTNDTDEDFIGMKFFVPTNAATDGTTLVPLLDENKQETGISVKISTT